MASQPLLLHSSFAKRQHYCRNTNAFPLLMGVASTILFWDNLKQDFEPIKQKIVIFLREKYQPVPPLDYEWIVRNRKYQHVSPLEEEEYHKWLVWNQKFQSGIPLDEYKPEPVILNENYFSKRLVHREPERELSVKRVTILSKDEMDKNDVLEKLTFSGQIKEVIKNTSMPEYMPSSEQVMAKKSSKSLSKKSFPSSRKKISCIVKPQVKNIRGQKLHAGDFLCQNATYESHNPTKLEDWGRRWHTRYKNIFILPI